MSDRSTIEWTDATWNPVRGCTKISPGCKHCYAETFAERWRGIPGHPYERGFDPRFVPHKLDEPLRWRRARRVFVNSMSDLFHEEVTDEQIAAVFGVMAAAHWHRFQVLTKRPERATSWFEWIRCSPVSLGGSTVNAARGVKWWAWQELDGIEVYDPSQPWIWPLPNVWLGVSVEDREHGVPRIAQLRATPAAIRFLSIEPLLEDLGELDLDRIDWVIVGGESGPGARWMKADWVRSIRDQCASARVPFFFKQWGGHRKKRAGRILDGRTHDDFPEVPR